MFHPIDLRALIFQRLAEAEDAVGTYLRPFRLFVDETNKLAHFSQPRGFAFVESDGTQASLTVAGKMFKLDKHNFDAIVRHEIGHVVDFLVPDAKLRRLFGPGLHGAQAPERRADDIAEAIWGDRIQYDRNDVQTLRPGTWPRPLRLGL